MAALSIDALVTASTQLNVEAALLHLKAVQTAFDESEHPRDEKGRFAGTDAPDAIPSTKDQDKAIDDTKKQLGMIVTMMGKHPGITSPQELILTHGKPYYMDKDSFTGKRGPAKACYMNAYYAMQDNPKLTYVEGQVNIGPLSIEHAWCADSAGRVIDSTLPAPKDGDKIAPRGYFGIPFQRDYVNDTAMKTGVYGIISGMSNRPLLQGKVPVAKFLRASSLGYARECLESVIAEFDESLHPRDEHGKFTDGDSQEDRMTAVMKKAASDPAVWEAEHRVEDRGDSRNDSGVLDANGKYTPAADDENRRIADSFLDPEAKPAEGHPPVALFMVGKPGAGKSTVLGMLGGLPKMVNIDSDAIKSKLPGYEPALAQAYHERSCDISRSYLTPDVVAKGYNVAFDMTDNKDRLERTAALLKGAGYRIVLIHADVDQATSLERVYDRFRRGGRYVPLDVVKSYGDKPQQAYDNLKEKGIADEWRTYDTSKFDPTLTDSGSKGGNVLGRAERSLGAGCRGGRPGGSEAASGEEVGLSGVRDAAEGTPGLLRAALGLLEASRKAIWAYSDDEERDDHGKWTTGGNLKQAEDDKTQWPQHIQDLKIPPAWTGVRYSDDPKASLLAIGKDSKGRDQYVYSQEFKDSQAALKFERVQELAKEVGLIDKQIAGNQKSDDDKLHQHADVAALIRSTGIRPGSETDTQAKVKAYGATTLEGRHVRVSSTGNVRLNFTGKKGVALNLPVDDKRVAAMLIARKAEAGNSGQIFPSVSNNSLLNYIHENLDHGGFASKDFRTLLGTTTAQQMVSSMRAPSDMKSYMKAVRSIGDAVAEKLGNTRSVALSSYIAPQVFSGWKMTAGVTASASVQLPDVYYGEVTAPGDFRDKQNLFDDDDSDTEKKPDSSVIKMLGFDPADMDAEESEPVVNPEVEAALYRLDEAKNVIEASPDVLSKIKALPNAPEPTGKWTILRKSKERQFGKGNWKKTPIHLIEKPPDALAFKLLPVKVRDKLVDDAPVRSFDPRELVTNQPVVQQKDLEHFYHHGEDPEPVIVLKTKAGLYIHNGNHRTTIAMLSGKRVDARYIDLSQVKQIKASTPAEALVMLGDALAAYSDDEARDSSGKWTDGGFDDERGKPESTGASRDAVQSMVKHINSKDWYHVPVSDPKAFKERGKFLSSTYHEAEFYGKPGPPEKVAVSRPLIGAETAVHRELFGTELRVPELTGRDFYKWRSGLDKQMKGAALAKGYDSIVILAPKAAAEFTRSGKIPRSIELNILNPSKEVRAYSEDQPRDEHGKFTDGDRTQILQDAGYKHQRAVPTADIWSHPDGSIVHSRSGGDWRYFPPFRKGSEAEGVSADDLKKAINTYGKSGRVTDNLKHDKPSVKTVSPEQQLDDTRYRTWGKVSVNGGTSEQRKMIVETLDRLPSKAKEYSRVYRININSKSIINPTMQEGTIVGQHRQGSIDLYPGWGKDALLHEFGHGQDSGVQSAFARSGDSGTKKFGYGTSQSAQNEKFANYFSWYMRGHLGSNAYFEKTYGSGLKASQSMLGVRSSCGLCKTCGAVLVVRDDVEVYSEDQPRDEHGKFTDGGDAGLAGPRDSAMEMLNPSMSTHEQKAAIVRNEARRQGFPTDKVEVKEGSGREFEVGGVKFSEGGNANLQTGVITVFPDVSSDAGIGGLMAHEIEHQRFGPIMDLYNAENSSFSWTAMHDHELFDKITTPDGFLDPDKGSYAHFPMLTELQPFFDGDGAARLREDDGITSYSVAYWKGYANGTVTRDLAIHETLAEMARTKWFGRNNVAVSALTPTKIWRDLYKTVDRIAREKGFGR